MMQAASSYFLLSKLWLNIVSYASEGMHHPPRGERLMLPTAGPSGMHERLNCWLKKRRMNVLSHFSIVSSLYLPMPLPSSGLQNTFFARKSIFAGE